MEKLISILNYVAYGAAIGTGIALVLVSAFLIIYYCVPLHSENQEDDE